MDSVRESARCGLKISDDVIISAARLAALDVKGVASLDGDVNMLSKLRRNGPISIEHIGDVASIDLRIIVRGGEKACAVAQEVQSAVKENVQSMTGVTVAVVNVSVSGVVFENK